MNCSGLRIRTQIKGGKLAANHTRGALKVRTSLKAGKLANNHSRTML
jgi:hypothetical protein